jgi:hypothetical protein
MPNTPRACLALRIALRTNWVFKWFVMRVAVAFAGLGCACALPSAPGVTCGRAAGAPQAAGAIPRLLGGPAALATGGSAVASLRGGAADAKVKKDLLHCQKRLITLSKETCLCAALPRHLHRSFTCVNAEAERPGRVG